MTGAQRVVLDTNVLVSAALWPSSMPGRAFAKALGNNALVVCPQSLEELDEVLRRRKFDRVAPSKQRLRFIALVRQYAEQVPLMPQHVAQARGACRDPDDDLFLALALAARARVIVSGDADLLALHPWCDIAICTAAVYAQEQA